MKEEGIKFSVFVDGSGGGGADGDDSIVIAFIYCMCVMAWLHDRAVVRLRLI